MRIVLRTPDGQTEVDVGIADVAATAGDLADALAPTGAGGATRTPGTIRVDGRRWPPSTAVAATGLHTGSVVDLTGQLRRARQPESPPGPARVLAVVGGLDAGARRPLPEGLHRIGRDPEADVVLLDPTVSRAHAVLEVGVQGVTVRAAGAAAVAVGGRRRAGGTTLDADEVLALGAVQLAVRREAPVPRAVLGPVSAAGTRPFHRPPPPLDPPAPEPVAVPAHAPAPAPANRFSWAAAAAPLVGGAVLAVLVNPSMAALALLSPLLVVGTWFEDRRRHRREVGARAVALHDDVAATGAALQAAAVAEAVGRRARTPDAAAVGSAVRSAGVGLWRRRRGDGAFGLVSLGTGTVGWDPPLVAPAGRPAPEVDRLVRAACLVDAPVQHRLGPQHALGLAGDRPAAQAVGRWVVLQSAAHHGPADVRVAVVTDRPAEWDWVGWLPHVRAATPGALLLAATAADVGDLVPLVAALVDEGILVVVVVDAVDPTLAAVAERLVGAVAGVVWVVVAATMASLPSRCGTVLEVDGDGWVAAAVVGGAPVDGFLATGVSAATAAGWARALAGLEDPDVAAAGADLPTDVRLLDLLACGGDPTATAVAAAWDRRRPGLSLSAPIGVEEVDGAIRPFVLDLLVDGPHGLVAGTTGAGKSELLRTVVAALAATHPPTQVCFALVDYKGGAAFASCALLPHVVGVVTDLDGAGASRALRSLEAELRHRERVLGDLGLRDLADHPSHRTGGAAGPLGVDPLPQLLVVVDELAVLAQELPGFVDALVAIAVRGRSLGVHLLLGTQRPAGVVSPSVRANTNLRIALRVQGAEDGVDVVGTPAPASLDRRTPGRAVVRLGEGERRTVQCALVTGARRQEAAAPVTVRPCWFGPFAPVDRVPPGADCAMDLDDLVHACVGAAEQLGLAPPRRPWLEPLADRIELGALATVDGAAVFGELDDPGAQRRRPLTWDPAGGTLLVVGSPGSGTTTALLSLAHALAAACAPADLHLYAVDADGGGLAPLTALPHVGAVVAATDGERLHRLIRTLAGVLADRRALVAAGRGVDDLPRIVLLVDNVGALRTANDGLRGLALLDAIGRVVVDGPGLGVTTVLAADRPPSIPTAWAAGAGRRLALRLADPVDLVLLDGGRVDQGRWPPGRALDLATGLEAQVALPVGRAPRAAGPGLRAAAIGRLPTEVALEVGGAVWDDDGLAVTLGVEDGALGPARLRLGGGDGALVLGPGRSGRSTVLVAVARQALATGTGAVVAVAPRRGPLAGVGLQVEDDLATAVDALPASGRRLLLVDDADLLDPSCPALTALLARRDPGLHVVAAARQDAVRGAFGHWVHVLRRSRTGLVLRPTSDLDGDLVGLPLLPRTPVPLALPGRGLLVVEGDASILQVGR